RLSRYGSPTESLFAPIDVVADLEAEKREPGVTRVLADLLGYDLVARESRPLNHTHVAAKLGAFASETTEVIKTIGDAVADNRITDAEVDLVDRELAKVQQLVAGMRKDVAAARKGSRK